MKLLMHICCANCCIHPIQSLKKRGVDITGYWYNPNIHPFTEYRERLNSLKFLEQEWNLSVEYDDTYGLRDFIRNVVNKEGNRCEYCYSIRLDEAARKARDYGMDAFTTSLLVSPYQKFDLIRQKGKEMAEKYNVTFLGEDFRPGYREGMKVSKDLGIYQQKYCGCIYSEMDRYRQGTRSEHPI